jgi:hypothetical protein
MTKAKSGPLLSLIPLEKQLESAVAYETEARLQRICIPSHELSTEYARQITHLELDRLVSRG